MTGIFQVAAGRATSALSIKIYHPRGDSLVSRCLEQSIVKTIIVTELPKVPVAIGVSLS